jgi:hypothetical protein
MIQPTSSQGFLQYAPLITSRMPRLPQKSSELFPASSEPGTCAETAPTLKVAHAEGAFGRMLNGPPLNGPTLKRSTLNGPRIMVLRDLSGHLLLPNKENWVFALLGGDESPCTVCELLLYMSRDHGTHVNVVGR